MAITVQNKFSEVKQRFHRLFELFENHLNGQKTQEFHQSRKKAINRLDELEFPTRRNEEWKYTSVKPILNLAFQQGGFVQLNSDQIAPFCFEASMFTALYLLMATLIEKIPTLNNWKKV